ncbi:MAG: hypothetical protein R3F61_09985 [Myxococcota bacterium]
MWFETLMGFAEMSPSQVREKISVSGDRMTSSANGRSYGCGTLGIPSLAELRAELAKAPRKGTPTLRQVVGDARALHADPANANATFQAASQFNLLEMVSPDVHPEEGVGIYENDRTQGPACAVSCGAGTIYRNYFVPVDGQIGQSKLHQIDCLKGVGDLLGNREPRSRRDEPGSPTAAAVRERSLWRMQNGYALLTEEGRTHTSSHIRGLDEAGRDALRAALRVGVHRDVEVTLPGAGHHVTQVYGAALALGYGEGKPADWEPLARVVLEASYEATLIAAALNAAKAGNELVLLTLIGGGVFRNDPAWILGAIERALKTPGLGALDVAIVAYRTADPQVTALVDRLAKG